MSSQSPQNDNTSSPATPVDTASNPKTPLETATQPSSAGSEPPADKTTALQHADSLEESEPVLDVHAITDTILAASSCGGSRRKRRNDARLLVDCLKEQFPTNARLFVCLHDDPVDDETKSILENVVQLPWHSPGRGAGSELPTLGTALQVCYCLSAWLQSDRPAHSSTASVRSYTAHAPIVIVLCDNGKTRTGLMIACFLKFLQRVDSVRDGLGHFLERRCHNISAERVLKQLPPSLHTFFRNFDNLVEFGTYLNRKPLLLKAVTMRGVPVEDAPCLDIWDASGRHLYSSHPHLYSDLPTTTEIHPSQWADDEGFYRVNCILEGDFCILCKFGGPYAEASIDSSKILFRYANSTGFMGSGSPYELPVSRVDLQRRYTEYFDPNDFLLSLIFDAHWNNSEVPGTDLSNDVLPELKRGVDALEAGWHLIAKYHVIQPQEKDVDNLIAESLGELEGCPKHIVSLALQLANGDSTMTQTILLEGRLRSWWQTQASDDVSSAAQLDLPQLDRSVLEILGEGLGEEEALQKIQSLLKAVGAVKRRLAGTTSRGERPMTKDSDTIHSSRTNIHYISPIMRPHPGDVRAILDSTRISSLLRNRQTSFMGEHPVFPLVPRRRSRNSPAPIDDPENDSAVELLLKLLHPSVSLEDLLRAAEYFDSVEETPNEPRAVASVGKEDAITKEISQGIPESQSSETEGALQGGSIKEETETKSKPQTTPTLNSPAGGRPASIAAAAAAAASAIANRQKASESKAGPPSIAAAAAAAAAASAISQRQKKHESRHESGISPETANAAASAVAAVMAKRKAAASMTKERAIVVEVPTPPGAAAAAAISKRADNPIGSGIAGAAKRQSQAANKPTGSGIAGAAAAAAAAAIAKRQSQAVDKSPGSGIAGAAAAAAAAAMAKRQSPKDSSQEGAADAAAAAAKQTSSGRSEAAAALTSAIADKNGQGDAASSEEQNANVSSEDVSEVMLKEDPRFKKYFKMLKMGLPEGAVRNAMQRDQVDESILSLDPEKTYASQVVAERKNDDEAPILRDDPRYQKYFKMLKMGLPDGAVRNAMQRDEVDPSILDLDPDKSLQSQIKPSEDSDPPIKDDPKFQKYFKMLKMGLPDGAVRNAMQRDGVDDSLLDLDPTKSLKSQTASADDGDDGIPIKDDPAFQKYFKMRKMGLPDGAVRNAMQRDGVDPSILDFDPEKSLKSQNGGLKPIDDGVPIKDDPAFQKYFKMMKMGLPEGAVRNAMERDGIDSSILDLDHDKSLQSQRNNPVEDDGVPLKDDPEWTKYFKMLKMGLPLGAVKNAVERDGKDPLILDLDHSKSIASQMKASAKPQQQKKKKRVRRKKIFWNPLDSKQIKADSLWSNVKGRIQMSQLKYDPKEFADLFTESADPADKKKEKKGAKPVKKAVQVIDGKRSMNGGIILARLKMDYNKIAEMVDQMKIGNLDSTSLKALKEMLPTPDEKGGLINYMKKCGSSDEAQAKGYADLSECEKYMFTMLNVPDAAAKYDCMLFRCQFKARFDELMESIEKIEQACDDVRSSEKLQAIMAIILTLVNEINTGGEGNTAAGFTLDALLKLREAKAFDKKTSVLNYLVKLVKSNDPTLLTVRDDLKLVKEAEFVILDALCSDIQDLKNEIEPISETVTAQAEELEKEGKLTQLTLKELTEQRTSVRNLDKVPQYNQVDHHTGRTPMERFVLNAEASIKDALASTVVVKEKFHKLLDYFGESSNMASNEFFGILNRFLTELDTAIQQVEREEKVKKREEEKRAREDKAKRGGANVSSSRESPTKTPMPPATTGIVQKNGEKPAQVSGIAAMAAAAAARKAPKESKGSASGIAAMAAAAAARKKSTDNKSTGDDSATKSPSPPLGLAAMAAAAAAQRKMQSPDNKSAAEKQKPTADTALTAPAAAGQSFSDVVPQAGPGIAALAAAAAVKKVDIADVEPSTATGKKAIDEVGTSIGSNIAAMAAQAAASKHKKSSCASEAQNKALPDIAAAAAAVAKDKAETTREAPTEAATVDKEDLDSAPGAQPFGIAAAAAAVARNKAETTREDSTEATTVDKEDLDAVPGTQPVGIAALAAAAALKRDRLTETERNIQKKDSSATEMKNESLGSTVMASVDQTGAMVPAADRIGSKDGESVSSDSKSTGILVATEALKGPDICLEGAGRSSTNPNIKNDDITPGDFVQSLEYSEDDQQEKEALYNLPKRTEKSTTKWLATLKQAIDGAAFETQEGCNEEDFDVRMMNPAPKKDRNNEWLSVISETIKKPPV